MYLLFSKTKNSIIYCLFKTGILNSIFNEYKIYLQVKLLLIYFHWMNIIFLFKGSNITLLTTTVAVNGKRSRKKYFNNGIHLMQNWYRI